MICVMIYGVGYPIIQMAIACDVNEWCYLSNVKMKLKLRNLEEDCNDGVQTYNVDINNTPCIYVHTLRKK